jgi:hypothetical protein
MNFHKQLLREVYYCTQCSPNFGFNRPTEGGPYFKFPPTIGALGKADLLFVGINPRISGNSDSHNNQDLHNRIIADKKSFAALAVNNDSGKAYIATNGKEKHYHHHAKIVAALYGRGEKFEDHAAVTELFFCASANSSKLPKDNYPCADLYFDRVFLKVRPRLVICVWKTSLTYFQNRFKTREQTFLRDL